MTEFDVSVQTFFSFQVCFLLKMKTNTTLFGRVTRNIGLFSPFSQDLCTVNKLLHHYLGTGASLFISVFISVL